MADQGEGGRILLIEDDAALRGVLVGNLKRGGHDVIVASDGLAGLEQLRAPGLDIVLLDIGLPFVDGWRILQSLDHRRQPSVIVISARGGEEDKVRALDLGADDYLTKPFGAGELLAEPTRIRLLWAMLDGEHAVADLASIVGSRPMSVSQHLAKLHITGLVRRRREGRRVLYAAEDAHVRRLLHEALYHADHALQGRPDHE